MPNPENLIPLTSEKAREIGRIGGLAKRGKISIKSQLKKLLKELPEAHGNWATPIVQKMIHLALTAGEIPEAVRLKALEDLKEWIEGKAVTSLEIKPVKKFTQDMTENEIEIEQQRIIDEWKEKQR